MPQRIGAQRQYLLPGMDRLSCPRRPGKTFFGPIVPTLTYMLACDGTKSMAEAWARFHVDPDWIGLKADLQYADTISNTTDIILRPEPYSEI